MGDINDYKMNLSEIITYMELRKELIKYGKILDINTENLNKGIVDYIESTTIYGYKKEIGYYEIFCERGQVNCSFKSFNKEEAIINWIHDSLHNYGFDYEVKNRKMFLSDWHYIWYFDTINFKKYLEEHKKVEKDHLIENDSWKYDIKYDCRKYAFEHIIQLLFEKNLDENLRDKMIEKYLTLINNKSYEKYKWIFDKEKREFILINR